MAARKTLARVEALIWTLIYGGLFAVIIGLVAGGVHIAAGWSLGVMGAIAVVTGVILIWVRSRMTETTTQSPRPNNTSQGST